MICDVPTVVCTPPPCPTGGIYSCPLAGNRCPGGCGVICVTPIPTAAAGEPLVIIGGITLFLFAMGRIAL